MSLRLVKVVCVATFVREDEEGNLKEVTTQPVAVSAKEWPDYPAKLLADAAEAEATL